MLSAFPALPSFAEAYPKHWFYIGYGLEVLNLIEKSFVMNDLAYQIILETHGKVGLPTPGFSVHPPDVYLKGYTPDLF